MEIPIPIHVDHSQVSTLQRSEANIDLKARSLRNTLFIILRRLQQLQKDSSHTLHDVDHYKDILENLQHMWIDDEGKFAGILSSIDSPLSMQCQRLWHHCHATLNAMEEAASHMPPEVQKIHATLSTIHSSLLDMMHREHTTEELRDISQQLYHIDLQRRSNNGLFVGDVESPAPGQAVCMDLLYSNFELLRCLERTAHEEPEELRVVADSLRGIQNELKLLYGHYTHHTFEDIEHYRFMLGAIASSEAEYATEWQFSAAGSLLEECFQLLSELESTAEPMEDSLKQVYSMLKKVKREMNVVLSTSIKRPAEADLKRWTSILSDIDEQRNRAHGIFGCERGDQENEFEANLSGAPPGQIACSKLFDGCYEALTMLKQR